MEKQRLIQMVNDALELLGETDRITDVEFCSQPIPTIVPLGPRRKPILTSVLPAHRHLHYADLNRKIISLAEAQRRFDDGQPVYVNNHRYEKE